MTEKTTENVQRAPETSAPRAPGTPWLIGVGVFVVLAIIVTLALAGSRLRSYEEGTPEATAQAFIQALFDEDPEAAHVYLSADLQERCDPDDIDLWWVQSSDSASFEDVKINGDHADIELRLQARQYDLGLFPFDFYDWDRETELELDRIDDEWVITNATWPLAGCIWRES